MSGRNIPSKSEVDSYLKDTNWGRWGDDDQLGAVNLITPEKRLDAVNLVKKGISVTLSRPVVAEPSADASIPPALFMIEKSKVVYNSGNIWMLRP